MRILTTLAAAALVTGCGSAYQSTSVREGVVDGIKVRVVELSPQTVLAANSQAYSPRSLPAVFGATAGTGSRSAAEAAALPDAASLPQTRPAALETRLPPPVPDQPYRIGVGDVVVLATRQPGNNVEELSGLLAAQNRRQGYTVQDDGSIAVPDVGRVRIGGMTLEEAEAEVFRQLVARQLDSAFSLEVAEFNSRRIAIGGAVARPGLVPVMLTPVTLDEVLAASGGVTAADRDSAAVRIYRDGTIYQIPLDEFYRRSDLQKLRLADGDSVFVDTEFELDQAQSYFAEQIQLATFQQNAQEAALMALNTEVSLRRGDLTEARANFQARLELGAEQRDYVYLTGEVRTQSRYALPYNQKATLADALYDGAGGVPVTTGNPREIYVLRGSPDPREFGGVTAWHLDAGSAASLILATRLELRPDDVVFIAEQPVTRWNRVIQQITPSLILTPLTTLADNN